MSSYHRSLERILDVQVKRLIDEISWVNNKIAMLSDSDEDEVERRLLSVMRSYMIKDLELLTSYKLERREAESS